jgi:hypothetical protein
MLLVGAGTASVPGGDDAVLEVRRFYSEHTGAILISQIVELIATLPLVLFLRGLAMSPLVRTGRDALLTGGAVVRLPAHPRATAAACGGL